MTNPPTRIEVVTSLQRRRRGTASEKVRMVEETFAPGMTVSLVARQHGVAPIGGARQPDCSRQRRGGGAGVGLWGVAEPGSRASSAARQEDPGGRDSQLRVCATFHRGGAEFTSQAVAPNIKDGSETSVLFPLPTSVVYPSLS
jgi:hypothetical protein